MKIFLKAVYNFLGIPLRMILLPDKLSKKIGLTSLEDERISKVISEVKGKLLDIGCGNNRLIKEYKNGIGVDVYDWGGGGLIVKDSSKLPFQTEEFDTVSFVADLNHIPNRSDVIIEAGRVLKRDGKIIVTMINPILGYVGHKIWWYGEDKERGVKEGEVGGMWKNEIVDIFGKTGFVLEKHKRFLYGMNNLYIFSEKHEN